MIEPIFEAPRLIQRLESKSRNNQVRFGERYDSQYMGSSEFEAGFMARALREMNGNIDHGEFEVDGHRIYAAWNRDNYNAEGVGYVLDGLFKNRWRTQDFTKFDGQTYLKQKEDSKKPRKQRASGYVDAWFDIKHGLFWTWEKINLKDIALNIARSVEYMDLSQGERREAIIMAPRGRASLQGKLGSIKEQLAARKE